MAKNELKNDEAIDAAHEGDDRAVAGAVSDTDQLTADLAAANDRALRLQAEMQNLRNRTSREIADERRYAALPVLRDLLPVIDNINRAIEAAEKAGEAENLLEGFRLVRQQLMTTLSRHQCEPIPAQGEPFDPHFHEAILQQPSADVPAGHVIMVTQPGYKLHERVVRPAQVIVSSGAPAQ
ncbi:MAG TPA: nucleotide exchange factor GrpE [Lacipirellulaceae bacterium]|nr:nucleotide exchange factor GrpE [Lacipirellulaceae bacterium]